MCRDGAKKNFYNYCLPENHFFRTALIKQKKLEMNHIPSEFFITGVYMPPMLVAATLGALAATFTAMLLNRYRLSQYFFYPPIVFLSMMVIFTMIIGFTLIPF